MSARARAGWVVGYAATTFLAFPHPVGDAVVDLGCVFAWLSPACLILALRGLPPRRALGVGFLAGWLAQSVILHWIYIVTVRYGGAPPLVGLLGPIGLGAHAALFSGAFAFAWSWLDSRDRASPWVAAVLWTLAEAARGAGQFGFPWATLGYAQHGNPLLLPIVAYTGVYGLSFVSVLGGAALARAFEQRAMSRAVVSGLSGAAAVAVAGAIALWTSPDPEAGERIRVAVLQGNIEQGVKWSASWGERTIGIYEDLSRRAAERGAEVIVYPESAVPGALNVDPQLRWRLSELARETDAAYAVGAVAVERRIRRREIAYFDSAFVLQPDGDWSDRYDKAQLVPFGEFIPFRDLLGRLLVAVARGIAEVGVTPGPGPRTVAFEVPRLAVQVTGAVPICYELLFPDLVRRFVDDGAELLLAITNDAWYGRTGAPHQFLAMTAVRSAETGVWTARAANTGVSAIIDSRGAVREQTRIFERGLLVADVPLRPPPLGGTFYTRHGDVFVWACGLAAVGLTAARFWRLRAGGGDGA